MSIIWAILIFYLVSHGFVNPLVISDTKTICSLRIKKKSLQMVDETFDITLESTKFHFSFCRPLPLQVCGGAHVCIKDALNETIYFNTSGMTLSNSRQILTLQSENKCMTDPQKKVTIQIIFYCSDPIKETPELIKKDNCGYKLRMMAPPNSMCKYPLCTMNLYGQLLDLRVLRGVYDVHGKHSNFSISLCQENPKCQERNITACKVSGGQTEPLANKDNEIILHSTENNQVYIRSSYKGSSHFQKKQLELIMKCNWNKVVPDIHYIEPQIQGTKYKFSLESKYACLRTPPKCEVPAVAHNDLYYNMSLLYNKKGYWEVKDAPVSIYLNICGPLVLQQAPNNNCSKSFSQVCKMENGKYVNLGSLQNRFTVLDDYIAIKYEAGDICNENGKSYETSIRFECSNVEQGPKYVNSTDCDISIEWSTPAACLAFYNNLTCDAKISDGDECSVKHGGHVYDLTSLSTQVNYVIYDDDNREIEYLMNICGSVADRDIPCTKDDMAVIKYVNEVDHTKRWKFLGKMSKIHVVGHRIAIETHHGSFCDKQYHSSITYLECSPSDEHIRLVNQTNCRHEFLFKTKAACPNPIEFTDDCSFRKPHDSSFRLDLKRTNRPVIKITYGESVYVFNICSRSGQFCLETEHCNYAAIKKDLFIFENKMYLDFSLDDTSSVPHFNRTLIELICNPIEYNDYYTMIGTEHNILYMTLATSLVCSQKGIRMPAVESHHGNRSSYIVVEEPIHSTVIKNPYNDYEFDIGKYKIEVTNITHKNVTFLYGNNSVMVEFVTKNACLEEPQRYYQYKLLVYCAVEHIVTNTSREPCIRKYTLGIPEGCKLLERDSITTATSSTSIILYVMATLTLICFLTVLGCWMYRKSTRRGYHSYVKQGDL